MHPHPTADPAFDDAQLDARVLDLLVHDHPGLWSVDELKHLLGDDAQDAIDRLTGLGAIHRLDGFVFASHATAHVHQLAS